MQIGRACVDCGNKRRGWAPLTRSPAPMLDPSRGCEESLSNRSSLPNRLDFACAGRLQQSEALARGLLRILVALSFVLDLQAGPFIRVDGPEVGLFEFAIGGGLRRQQRQGRPPDFWFGLSIWFGVSAGAGRSPDGRCLVFV